MLPTVNKSKPYSNEEEKIPKDFTAENRTKQKGAGRKDTLELVSGPIEPWAMGTGRANRRQGYGSGNESEIPGRTLVIKSDLGSTHDPPLWRSLNWTQNFRA